MEKESKQHDAMERFLSTKTRGHHSSSSQNPKPKTQDYGEHYETVSKSRQETYCTTSSNMSSMPRTQAIEDLDNDWDELIGYPVCISGVKQGILRYYGRTKFANGLWCGVELEEPVGKNDGTVNGVRYFYCKTNHGIFAPVTKVALLPPHESKQHSITPDHNFYRKHQKLLQHATNVEFSILKQSFSDSTFQKQNGGRTCQNFVETNSHFGDSRNYTEQRECSFPTDNGNTCGVYAQSSTKSENPLLYNVGNPSSMPNDMCSHVQHSNHAEPGRKAGTSAVCKEHATYMNFPRKVVSEYALNLHKSKVSLTQSRSCPHSTAGLTTFNTELPPVHKVQMNPTSETSPEFGSRLNRAYASENLFATSEFLNLHDDNDDDQMSLDCEESLGILTPSEMKDFTLCAEFPTSYSDTRALDFPSSESFDEVNELPEDEQVHDPSMQYIPAACSSIEQPGTSPPTQNSQLSHGLHQNTGSTHVLTSADTFFSSISSGSVREVNLGSDYASYRKHTDSISSCDQKHQSSICVSDLPKELNLVDGNELKTMSEHLQTSEDSEMVDMKESISLSKSECEQSEVTVVAVSTGTIRSQSSSKLEMRKQSREHAKVRKHYDTDSSRDSLLHEPDHIVFKEKQLTVSWEDCVAQSADEEVYNKVERPESVYTVGSNDTGYQEDGEFEPDAGMTTSIESSEEYKRFSTVSRDSCVACEDMDGDKVAESNSTSGYSTGLSDSCCNDRRDESGRPQMDDSFQDVVDSCNSDDAQDMVSFQKYNLDPEKQDGFFDMDNCKDSSDFHITESSTVLGLDVTCDALSKTITNDESTGQFNDKSSEDNKISSNAESVEASINSETVEKITDGSAPKTARSPTELTQQKIAEVQKKNYYNTNKNTPTINNNRDHNDKSKIDLKSPKRNVMSKIKAVIGGTN